MQLLSLIPILILILYLLVSIDLMYTGLCESVSLEKATIFFQIALVLSLIQIDLVLKLQLVSALTNKWVVS